MAVDASVNTKDEKVQVDTAPLNGDFESLATQKVQLDIDDAPFLNEPEEEAPAPPAIVNKEVAPVAPAKATPPPPKSKKKLIIILGAGLALLLVVAVAVYFFMFAPKAPEPPIIIVTPPEQAPPPPEGYEIKLDSFMVELTDPEGTRRFLNASFVLTTRDPMVFMEIEDKIITLRDSIYYYLKNQNYEVLQNPGETPALREDLINAVNEYIVQGNIDDILFDSYIIH